MQQQAPFVYDAPIRMVGVKGVKPCNDKLMGIAPYRLAREIGVPAPRINDITMSKRGITADTDLRPCRFFGLSNGYWLRAQAAYDTEVAEDTLSETLAKIKPWQGAPSRVGHVA